MFFHKPSAAVRPVASKFNNENIRKLQELKTTTIATIAKMLKKVSAFLSKNTTFYRVHLLYFLTLSIIGALILWTVTSMKFPFIDSVFTIVSGLCLGGLSAIPIERIPVAGQVLILLTMILGGQIFLSLVPLLIRKRRYCEIVNTSIRRPSLSSSSSSSRLTTLRRICTLRSKDDVWMSTMASKEHLPEHFRLLFLQHQAITAVTDIVICYYLAVQLFGFIVAWACIRFSPHIRELLHSKDVNIGFFALFAVVSAFSNTGFVVSNENMVPLNTSSLLLLDLAVVVWLGNTLFPVALRMIIGLLHRNSTGTKKEVYSLLLDHPRNYYQHLLPKTATRWLLITVAGLNGLGSLIFYVLDWNNKSVQSLGPVQKLVNGVFQAANTRSGGMNSLNLVHLSPAVLFVYCVSMYVHPYPVNLKEEQTGEEADTTICVQARRMLARDPTYLFLLVLLICISLNTRLKQDPRNFNIFNIVFEVASAYGCVGLTMGYSCDLRLQEGACTDTPISFSGNWNVPGKMLMILVMLLGRHRGLPDHIQSVTDCEKAILLLKRPQSLLQLVTI